MEPPRCRKVFPGFHLFSGIILLNQAVFVRDWSWSLPWKLDLASRSMIFQNQSCASTYIHICIRKFLAHSVLLCSESFLLRDYLCHASCPQPTGFSLFLPDFPDQHTTFKSFSTPNTSQTQLQLLNPHYSFILKPRQIVQHKHYARRSSYLQIGSKIVGLPREEYHGHMDRIDALDYENDCLRIYVDELMAIVKKNQKKPPEASGFSEIEPLRRNDASWRQG